MTVDQLKTLQPKLFEEFHQILKSGRLAHAYLFSGDFASLPMALMLAQACFCQQLEDSLPCQNCRSCRLIASNDFTDVKRLAPVNNIIKTDSVRAFLRDFFRSGFESEQQVFIIEEADKLHPNAANSLLKLIEEPQNGIHIFLLTNQETAVLPTIKSRCQIFSFPKNLSLMKETLEKSGLLSSQAKLLAQLCPDLESALDLGKSSHFKEILTYTQQWISQFLAGEESAYLTVAKLSTLVADKAEQEQVLDLLPLILSQNLPSQRAQKTLSQVLTAKRMWQANVSFQNALEYMIIN